MRLARATSDRAGRWTAGRPKVFVVMPFARRFSSVYEDAIQPALLELKCDVERVDEIYKSTPIIKDIERSIRKADLVVADLSERNANVLYELGYARGTGRPIVLITQRIKDVPFDLQHRRCFVYSKSFRGKNKLIDDLQQAVRKTLASDRCEWSPESQS